MANKKTLKGYFETGDIPNQSQYHELINSNLNLNETGTQSITGSLIVSQSVLLESDLTASGNISASGDMYANKYHSNGYNVLRYKAYGDQVLVGNKDKPTQITGSSLILGETPGFHITASGNISASGDIYATQYYVDDKLAIDYAGTSITYGQNNQNSHLRGATILLGQDNTQHITASGHISASGEITANKFYADGAINTLSHITASGNISSSGDIYANAYYGDGSGLTNAPSTYTNITASGNISASGTVIASDYTLDGVALTTTFTELNYLDGVLSNVANAYDTVANVEQGTLRFTDLKADNSDIELTNLNTEGQPTFAGLSLTKSNYGVLNLGQTTTHAINGTQAGQISVRAVPSMLAGASSPFYILTGTIIKSTSVIMISTDTGITCNATNIIDDGCKITFHNPTQTAYLGGDVTINIVIL